MSSTTRAWVAVASVAAIERLKDQGLCTSRHTLRSLYHHSKAKLRSVVPSKKLSSMSSMLIGEDHQVVRHSEESVKEVLYLNCWGPG